MRLDAGVRFVVDVVTGEECNAFGPVEGGDFARRVDAGFAPCGEQVKFGCGDVELAGVVEMILHTESATVELRDADLEDFDEIGLDYGLTQKVANSKNDI